MLKYRLNRELSGQYMRKCCFPLVQLLPISALFPCSFCRFLHFFRAIFDSFCIFFVQILSFSAFFPCNSKEKL